MDSVFAYKDYKKYLQDRISGLRGESTRIAMACGCEKSYLSRVMRSEVHITPDHAFRMSEYWQLNQEEQEYFLLLVEEARAGDFQLKKYLQKKMLILKKNKEELKNIAERPLLEENEDEIWYNSSWLHCAVHMMSAVPRQTVEAMSKRFHVSSAVLNPVLSRLQKMGYIEKKQGYWQYLAGEAHLSRFSPLVAFHHINWRNQALSDLLDSKNESVHFTNVQTLSMDDAERLKQMILSFIHDVNKLAGPSKSEELICLNIDYFKV